MHVDTGVAGEKTWDMAEREQLIRAKVPELVQHDSRIAMAAGLHSRPG